MKLDYSFVLGFTTLAFAYYLGYLWSPNYQELITNGIGHLFVAFFGIAVLIGMVMIDLYYKVKEKKQGVGR